MLSGYILSTSTAILKGWGQKVDARNQKGSTKSDKFSASKSPKKIPNSFSKRAQISYD